MSEPTTGLTRYQSIKRVWAGKITEVVAAGCYVREANGGSVLRMYPPNMTARYTPVVGDFWIIYDDGYQSISPKAAFDDGYVLMANRATFPMNALERITAILEKARVAGGWIDEDVAAAVRAELGLDDDGKPVDRPPSPEGRAVRTTSEGRAVRPTSPDLGHE